MHGKTCSTLSRRVIGDRYEDAARLYLEDHGLRFVRAKFLCRFGEIDLVMLEREVLVFVEVRYRRSGGYGGALASITKTKQQRLISAAHVWFAAHPWDTGRPCRFDVMAFEGDAVEWVRGAFDA